MNISHRFNSKYNKQIIKESMTYYLFTIIRNFLFDAPIIKYFFDPYKLAPLWYESSIFHLAQICLCFITKAIKPLSSGSTIKRTLKIQNLFEHITGISILISAILPHSMYSDANSIISSIFIAELMLWFVIFVLKFKTDRQAVNLCATLILLGSFFTVYSVNSKSGIHFGIIFSLPLLFFIIESLSLNKNSNSQIINKYCALSLFIISTIVICSKISGLERTQNMLSYTNIIALLTPLALSDFLSETKCRRQIISISATVIFSVIPVTIYGNILCRISYFITLLLITAFAKPRFLLYIVFLTPAIIKLSAEYIIRSLNAQLKYNTPVENIISLSKNLWSNSLGSGYKPFLNVYSTLAEDYGTNNSIYTYINESYHRTFYNIGFVLIFIFIWFSLKAMRNCVSDVFKKQSTHRLSAVCSVTFLLSASISGFIAANITNLGIATLYWLILASVTKNN